MGLLREATILLIATVIAVPLFKRLKLGAILGYLVAGVVLGPHVSGLIHDAENILHFSEFGVVLFLFLVGIELEPRRLWALRRSVFGLGTAQMLATGGVLGLALLVLFGMPFGTLAIVGMGLALSSTAIALQLLAERGKLTSESGRTAFAILLFQDLAVIPLLALVPAVAGKQGTVDATARALGAVKVIVVIAVVVIAGRYLVRPLFRFIARTHAHEVFTPAALLVVVGTAMLMTMVDLSMALGAFLAGVLLAESEYRHELEADIEPFKGLLLGLFFTAVGMTADVRLLAERPVAVLAAALGLMACKFVVLMALGRLSRFEQRESITMALSMSQGGEFAFVLFGVAASAGVLWPELSSFLVVVVSVSMALAPLMMAAMDAVLARMGRNGPTREFDTIEDVANPVIIAGFGRYGQIIGRILNVCGIGFTALESSAEQVDVLRRFGNRIFFGDASRLDLLRAAKAEQARAFVLAIDDMAASLRTAEMVKKAFPTLPIYARARNRQHAYRLMDLGVAVLNRETLFSSLEMATHVLQGLGFTAERARDVVQRFHAADEDMLRRQHAVYTDETLLIQTSRQVAAEMRALFEQDARRTEQIAPAPDGDQPKE